jgi:general stress protein YciG
MTAENLSQKTTSKRGFASMDPQRQKEIASLGGKAAHASGKAHEFNTAEAREAGRKGGRAGRRSAASNSPSES